MGLTLHAQKRHRACSLTTVRVPEGVDAAKIVTRLLKEYNTEISGGLGTLKGKIWRIGLMGYGSTRENVLLILSALEKLLTDEGFKTQPGAGVAAAIRTLNA